MSLNYNWRKGNGRGPSLIAAMPQRLGTPADARWATGRNVKMSLPDHRYTGVEVWTLKARVDGKVVTVASGRSYEQAKAWVAR